MARMATVFGGSGFIGRYVVKDLAASGWVVRAAVRRPAEALFLKPMGDVGQITPFRVDIGSDEAVQEAVNGADAVVNLIGILFESGRSRFDKVHGEAAGRIARAAQRAGSRRLVQISAIGADPASPAAYGRSKAAGEAAVLAAMPSAVILRPSIVFGPEDDFFNRFAALAQFLPILPLFGGGRTRFQPVYVGDVADAIMVALDDPATNGQVFELGGPRTYSFKELMTLMLAEIHRRRLLVPVPFALAAFNAMFLELLPTPPLTRDQLKMLQRDTVVSAGMPGLRDLGITPTAAEAILPTYLDRFRPGGRFAPLRSIY
jgi:uncharacterized protein YbjT (DUF2867 family)